MPSLRGAPEWRTVASALLIAASLPPWNLGFLVWVALVPWLSLVARLPRGGAALQGCWLAFGMGVLVAPWVAVAVHEFLGLAWPLCVLVLALFAATCAQPHWILWALVVRWGARRAADAGSGVATSLLLCAALAFADASLGAFVPRWLDVGLGYALHGAAHLRQIADLGGVALLTLLVVWVNTLIWQLWEHTRRERQLGAFGWIHAGAILALWALAFGYGAIRKPAIEAAYAAADRSIRVGVVQGNVPNAVRLEWARGDDRAAEKQLSAYMLPTEEWIGREPPLDLVVWPEATFPGIFGQPASAAQRGRANKFDRQVLRLDVPIAFGAYDREEEEGEPVLYNALFAITPRYDRSGAQGLVQRYRKHDLLAFAETLPGFSRTSPLRPYLPRLGFFGHGRGAQVFDVETPRRERVRIAPAICSESLSAAHAAAGARLGAELILNVGSDGWFGAYGEPEFHLAIATLRSVETRLPQVRAANTGISALIFPDGAVVERSELAVATTLELAVPLAHLPETRLVRWGDWFGRASLPVAVLLLLAVYRVGALQSHRDLTD